jgi:hypothetical protein
MAKATTMTSSAGWSDQPRQQLGRQGVQVNLVPQPDAERLDRPDGIELAAGVAAKHGSKALTAAALSEPAGGMRSRWMILAEIPQWDISTRSSQSAH